MYNKIMYRMKMLKSDEVVEVTANERHGLLEREEAEDYVEEETEKKKEVKKAPPRKRKAYNNRMLKTS